MAQSKNAMMVELDVSNNSPAPKAIMSEAFSALRDCGYNGLSVGELEPDSHKDVNGGITPKFANEVRKMDNSGCFDHMDLRDNLQGASGDISSSHVTTIFVRSKRTVKGVIRDLADRGHIDAAIDKVASELTGDIDLSLIPDDEIDRITEKATKMVSYQVATTAKGWIAEKVITESESFAKGSMSNDEAEQDVRAYNDGDYDAPYFQVKSVTLGYKPNGTIESTEQDGHFKTVKNDIPVLFYQWDCNGHLIVGLNYKEVNGIASDAKGVSKTLIGRTHSSYTFEGRTYRYLWW